MRCSVGEIGVAIIQLIIDGIRAGFAFLALARLRAAPLTLLLLGWFMTRGGGERGLRGWLSRKTELEVEKEIVMTDKVQNILGG